MKELDARKSLIRLKIVYFIYIYIYLLYFFLISLFCISIQYPSVSIYHERNIKNKEFAKPPDSSSQSMVYTRTPKLPLEFFHTN